MEFSSKTVGRQSMLTCLAQRLGSSPLCSSDVLVRNVWGQGDATTVSLVSNGGPFQFVPKESPSLPFLERD